MDKSSPPYIVIWTKLIGGWPSIVNGGCRFALQASRKFLDQVRILAKTKILWNQSRILLSPGAGERVICYIWSRHRVAVRFYPAWYAGV